MRLDRIDPPPMQLRTERHSGVTLRIELDAEGSPAAAPVARISFRDPVLRT